MGSAQWVGLAFILVFVIIIVTMMIRKKSNASISLLWLGFAMIGMLIAVIPGLFDVVSEWLGIAYPPILLVMLALLLLMVITFYISSELAVALNKIRELSIQISLLNDEIYQLKTTKNPDEM